MLFFACGWNLRLEDGRVLITFVVGWIVTLCIVNLHIPPQLDIQGKCTLWRKICSAIPATHAAITLIRGDFNFHESEHDQVGELTDDEVIKDPSQSFFHHLCRDFVEI